MGKIRIKGTIEKPEWFVGDVTEPYKVIEEVKRWYIGAQSFKVLDAEIVRCGSGYSACLRLTYSVLPSYAPPGAEPLILQYTHNLLVDIPEESIRIIKEPEWYRKYIEEAIQRDIEQREKRSGKK